MMYDIGIIGGGTAGMTAAIYGQRAGKRTVIIEAMNYGGQITVSPKVENYPGIASVSGAEFSMNLLDQAMKLGAETELEQVTGIREEDGIKVIETEGKEYPCRTVIIATGVTHRHLGLDREEALLGAGVSYCATCDGGLYRGKRIAVVCTDSSLEEEIEFLADLASEVFLCTSYKDCGIRRDNVRHAVGYPSEILGADRAVGIVCGGETLAADGIFCLRSCVAPAALLPGLAAEGGHIQVDRQQRTNLPGCFAAGDCTGRPYQYAKAVGEGNVALHSAVEYIKKAVV